MKGFKIPQVTFRVREGDIAPDGGCNFDEGCWVDKTTDDYFSGKKSGIVQFAWSIHTYLHIKTITWF